MRFWDSSAVVPLLVDEPGSAEMHRHLGIDPAQLVGWTTEVECASAVSRRQRDRSLDTEGVALALGYLDELAAKWAEVQPAPGVRALARRLLRVHPLPAADSLQLAAALTAADRDPASLEFVCLDDRLRDAAAREGLRVVGELA